MICRLCKEKESLPNSLVCSECMDKAKYHAKASVLLDGIESGETKGVLLLSPEVLFTDVDLNNLDTLEVCGTWGYMDNGRLWVHLETPLQALQDKATLLLKEFVERKRKGLVIPQVYKSGESHEKKVRTGASRTPKPRKIEDESQEVSLGQATIKTMQELRAKLHPQT